MRRLVVAATAVACMAIPVVALGSGAGAEGTQAEGTQEFVVLYTEGASTADAQAGVIGVLTVAYGIPLAEATAITILDWVISVLSIIVFGAVLYVVSPMPRGMGNIVQPPTAKPAATAA